MSYVVEVQTDSTGKWYTNHLIFPIKGMADAYGSDLYTRWTAVKSFRVVESDKPANYEYENGKIMEIRKDK